MAGRTAVYGLSKTASLLDDHLNLSWAGRPRTAAARHQTLNATLEWSYNLLDERESQVLSRLSVFSGGFTFETAIAVVADEKVDESDGVGLYLGASLEIIDCSRWTAQIAATVARHHAGALLCGD